MGHDTPNSAGTPSAKEHPMENPLNKPPTPEEREQAYAWVNWWDEFGDAWDVAGPILDQLVAEMPEKTSAAMASLFVTAVHNFLAAINRPTGPADILAERLSDCLYEGYLAAEDFASTWSAWKHDELPQPPEGEAIAYELGLPLPLTTPARQRILAVFGRH